MFGNYCSKCGKDLQCYACNGTGEGKDYSGIKSCCGSIQSGNYCSLCGKSLSPLIKPKCFSCNGTGQKVHICRGF